MIAANVIHRTLRVAFLLVLWGTGSTAIPYPLSENSDNTRPCDDGSGAPLNPYQSGFAERMLGVCGLENKERSFGYKTATSEQGSLSFQVRSCSTHYGPTCEFGIPFAAYVDAQFQSGGNFQLRNSVGNKFLDIELVLSSGGQSEPLTPGVLTNTLFSGGNNGQLVNAELEVQISNPGNLGTDVYTGTFYLMLDQCGERENDHTYPGTCDGSKVTTRFARTIPFTITVVSKANIRISGLDDVDLSPDASGSAESSQTFCVFTTGGVQFHITPLSQNGTGAFILRGIDDIVYQVELSDTSGQLTDDTITEGQPSESWPGHTRNNCRGSSDVGGYNGDNMALTIRVAASEINKAQDSVYTDVLTLVAEVD